MLDTAKITRQDILQALKEIDIERASGKWNQRYDAINHFIVVDGKEYPIKNPIERAYYKLYGKDIYDANNGSFTTHQARPIMKQLGFEVIVKESVANNEKTDDGATTNVILYGPPGTGKTYSTKRRSVNWILGMVEEDFEYGGSDLRLESDIRSKLQSVKLHGRLHPIPGLKQSCFLFVKNLSNNIGYGVDISKQGEITIFIQSYEAKDGAETDRNNAILEKNRDVIGELIGLKFLKSVKKGPDIVFYYDYGLRLAHWNVDSKIADDIVKKIRDLDIYIFDRYGVKFK